DAVAGDAGAARPGGVVRRLRRRGGRRRRARPAAGARAGAAGGVAGPGARDQQAGVDLRDDGRVRDVLPAGPAAPGDVPAVDGVRVPRVVARGAGREPHPGVGVHAARARRAARGRRLRAGATGAGGADRAPLQRSSAHRRGDAGGAGDRGVRRRARSRDRVVLRVHARGAARLRVPRGVCQGTAGELGDQPGGAVRLRAAGRGAVADRAAHGGRQPRRRLPRRADRGGPRRAVHPRRLPARRGGVRAPPRCGRARPRRL
ncbi:MAG: putative membrane protein, partial [uncultured Nocardioidaceae bacterium]